MIKKTFPLLGLHCAACASHATKALEGVTGVSSASVNLSAATAFVVYDEKQCSPEDLRDAVSSMGYDLRIDEASPEEIEALRHSQERAQRHQAVLAILLSLIVMGLMMAHPITPLKASVSALLTTIVLLVSGRGFYTRGWQQLRARAAGMDLLVALSTGTAFVFSLVHLGEYFASGAEHHLHHLYFEAASMTIAFVLLGKVIEARAQRRTATALRQLMGSQPREVLLVEGEQERMISVEEVEPGMLLRAQPGALFAVDGLVVEGESYADEQLISGEPIPVAKTAGAQVYAGTLNGSGSLTYRASEVGRATLLARIIRLVQELRVALNPLQVSAFAEVAGRGLQGTIGGRVYRVGSRAFVEEAGISLSPEAQSVLEEGERAGATCSLYASEEEVLAVLVISDTIRPTSSDAIAHLRARGIEVVMLTGDGAQAAEAVADRVGGISYIAGVLPEGKAEHIRRLQSEGHRVAMVGDGINDAAALALADLSIAMGQGSDLAMETAMVTIRSSSLEAVGELLDLSRRTLETIRQNLFWACIYNFVAVPVAAGLLYPFTGYLMSPMLAGGLMMLSSLSVVSNSILSFQRKSH